MQLEIHNLAERGIILDALEWSLSDMETMREEQLEEGQDVTHHDAQIAVCKALIARVSALGVKPKHPSTPAEPLAV